MLQLTPTNVPAHLHRDASTHQRTVRPELQQQREFRVRQLEELEATIASASSFSADEPQHQVILDLRSAAAIALAEIDAALKRMEIGTYGKCERCHTGIPQERLAVLPMVRFCMPCQAAHEAQMRRDAAARRLD